MFPQRIGRCTFFTPYGEKYRAEVRNIIFHNPYSELRRFSDALASLELSLVIQSVGKSFSL